MKRPWLLFLCAASCATGETRMPTAVPAEATSASLACPQQRSDTNAALETVLGKRVVKVCVVGGSADLSKLVEGVAGEPLGTARVAALLQELFATDLVRDAEVVATPVDGERVVLTWFIRGYDPIAKVRVTGRQGVAEEVFMTLTTERFAHASPLVLASLRDAVREIYAERGYTRAKVAVAMANGDAVVTVEEGTRDEITRIRFSGAKRVKEADLREAVKSREGSVFVADGTGHDVIALETLYLNRGMVQAKVTSSYQDGELLFTVTEGDVFKLRTLKLTGLDPSEGAALLASLGSKRGAVFSRAAVVRDIERIRDHAGRKGTPVNVVPVTEVDVKKKVIDITFELSPAN